MIGEANLSLPPLAATNRERDFGKLKQAAQELEGQGLSREEKEKRLKKACDQFEALLVKMVLKSMRDATPKEGLFGSGLDQDIYTSMMDDALAESIATGKGLGISRTMYEQMKGRLDAVPAGTGIQGAPATQAAPETPVTAVTNETEIRNKVVEFALPLEGRLSSDFGWRRDPITAENRFHKGIDLAAPRGTPVLSSAEGTVVFSGWQGGHGNTVVIRHPDGYETRYSHNAQNLVREGDRVGQGDMIARVGSTGRSTGPHLHFEVTKGGASLDPTELLA